MVRSFFSLTQFFTAILPLLDSTTEFRFFYPGFFDGLISSCLVASKVLAPNTFEQVSSPYSPSSAFLSQDDPYPVSNRGRGVRVKFALFADIIIPVMSI